MKKIKIQRKLSKNQKSLLIGLLIGDGTICSNYVFKLSHSNEQLEYLKWKIKLLNDCNIKTNGIKKYISKCGFNTGKEVIYSQLAIIPTIKALRRSIYIPNKTITRKLLNWLTEREIAIWYMDDGYININQSKQRSSIQHTALARHTTHSQDSDRAICRSLSRITHSITSSQLLLLRSREAGDSELFREQ